MRLSPFSTQDQLTITTLGLEFAIAVALGTGLGFWADRRWSTTPWCMIVGMLLGFALGMYIVVREAQRMSQKQAQGKKRD